MSIRFDHIAIRASAGTGKTFSLTNRYLRLLAMDVEPRRICAVTFTRKAAAEIAERLLLRLAEGATDAGKLRELRRHVHEELTADRCAELLRRLVGDLHQLRISTLDSLYAAMARAFAFEIDLPVDWTIAEPTTDMRLRLDAITDMLAEGEHDQWVSFVRSLNRGEFARPVAQQIASTVNTMHGVYVDAPDPAQWNWIGVPEAPDLDAMAEQIVERIAAVDPPLTNAGSPNKSWATALGELVDAAHRRDWKGICFNSQGKPKGPGGKLFAGETQFNRHEIPAELREALEPVCQYLRAEMIADLHRRTMATYLLLHHFDQAYRRRQRDQRAAGFDQVTRSVTRAALAEQTALINFRLDGWIDHLLLDEFQDTSLIQWQALLPIADEIVQDAERRRSFYCVGDRKQAIYGWRGGEAAIFDSLDHALHGAVQWDDLHTSYRSAQPIVDATNAIFADLPNNAAVASCREAAAHWHEGFPEHRTARGKLAGYAELRVAQPADDDQRQRHVTLAEAARLVAEIVAQAPGASVGVLVRRNASVNRLIYELRREVRDDAGHVINPFVDASGEGGNPLTDSPAVSAVLSLLTLADHPADTTAAHHVAISPLGPIVGLDDANDRAVVRRTGRSLRRRLSDDGYGTTIRELVRKLAPRCDQRNQARLLHLVDLAERYDAEPTARPIDFVRHVQATAVEEPTAAPVRVMTVHKAKGLEFDVVVLGELDEVISGQTPSVLIDRPDPTGPIQRVSRYADQTTQSLVPQLQAMAAQQERRAVADGLSVLYVAATRPKHALYMLVPPDQPRQRSSTYARLLRHALHGDRPFDTPGVVWSVGDANWHAQHERFAAEDQAKTPRSVEPAHIELAAPTRRRRVLARTSPSQLADASHRDVEAILRLDFTAARHGSTVHALCQHIDWLDGEAGEAFEAWLADTDAVRRALAALAPGLDPVEPLIAQFRQTIAQPAIRAALCRAAYPANAKLQVWRERAFAIRHSDGVMTGAIDRLVRIDAPSQPPRAHVLDYKTDAGDPAELADRYRPQLDAYRQAAARLLGVPADRVTTTLLLLSCGTAMDV